MITVNNFNCKKVHIIFFFYTFAAFYLYRYKNCINLLKTINKKNVIMKTKTSFKEKFRDDGRFSQTNSLKELLADVLVLFDEYAEKHKVSEYQKEVFKNTIFNYYIKKKGEIYLNEYLNDISANLNHMVCNAIGNIKQNDFSDYHDFYYYNKKKRQSIIHHLKN